MAERNERLWTIEAEIDRCMGEIGFLGSALGGVKSQARIDILSAVNSEVRAMEIGDDSPLLQSVLAFIKPELDKLLKKIISMDLSQDEQWGKLKSKLDMFCATLKTLTVTTPHPVSVLFDAIRKGIVILKPKTREWMQINDREVYFKRILNNIGGKMREQHDIFSPALPQGVVQRITSIENTLIGGSNAPPVVNSTPVRGWKKDLEWVETMVHGMNLPEGSPLTAIMTLVKPYISAALKMITKRDIGNTGDAWELYREIRNFQVVASFLSFNSDLEPLFSAIVRGIQDTMPTEEDWRAYTTEKRKQKFITCLKQIGNNIHQAKVAILDTQFSSIEPRITRVAICLKNTELID